MPDVRRAAVLASGGGSNLGAILDAQKSGLLKRARVTVVVGSKGGIGALARAEAQGIPTRVVDKTHDGDLIGILQEFGIDLILLAGYLRKLSPAFIEAFRGRILNIHPSLLPKFGGPGMYGHFVHDAVIRAGEKESGCTVHGVDEEFDHGPVLGQARVPVLPEDTSESLAARILKEEHTLYPRLIEEFCQHHD